MTENYPKNYSFQVKMGIWDNFTYLETEPSSLEDFCNIIEAKIDTRSFVIYYVDSSFKKHPINSNKKYLQLIEYRHKRNKTLTLYIYKTEEVAKEDVMYSVSNINYISNNCSFGSHGSNNSPTNYSTGLKSLNSFSSISNMKQGNCLENAMLSKRMSNICTKSLLCRC